MLHIFEEESSYINDGEYWGMTVIREELLIPDLYDQKFGDDPLYKSYFTNENEVFLLHATAGFFTMFIEGIPTTLYQNAIPVDSFLILINSGAFLT